MTTACWVSGWGVHPLPDSTSRALCGRATSRRKCPGTVRFLGHDIQFLRSTNKWKARAGGPIVMVGRREIESRAGLSDRFLRRCLLRPPGGNFPDRLLPRVELARTRFLGHYLDGDRLWARLPTRPPARASCVPPRSAAPRRARPQRAGGLPGEAFILELGVPTEWVMVHCALPR